MRNWAKLPGVQSSSQLVPAISVLPKDGAGRMRKVAGVNFLLLQGDAVARARQHGRYLKNEIWDGVPMVLEKKNEWIIRRGLNFLHPRSIFMEIPLWIYRNILISLFDRGHEPRYRWINRALSEETGIPISVFRESIFHADALMLLARTSVMKHLVREWPSIGLPGCTSAAVLGGWTQSGRLLAARNMDYPLIGPWEKHSTVFFHEPSEPGEIPHLGAHRRAHCWAHGHEFGGSLATRISRGCSWFARHGNWGRGCPPRAHDWAGRRCARKTKRTGTGPL